MSERTDDPKLLHQRMTEVCKILWGEKEILPSDDPRTSVAYWEALKMRDERDELFQMVSKFQLAKLDAVWTDKRFAAVHHTKPMWKLRWNQPDIFVCEVGIPGNREYAILLEKNGKWVGGEQHYPMPFVNSQSTHKLAGDAMLAAFKAAQCGIPVVALSDGGRP